MRPTWIPLSLMALAFLVVIFLLFDAMGKRKLRIGVIPSPSPRFSPSRLPLSGTPAPLPEFQGTVAEVVPQERGARMVLGITILDRRGNRIPLFLTDETRIQNDIPGTVSIADLKNGVAVAAKGAVAEGGVEVSELRLLRLTHPSPAAPAP